MGTMDGIIDTVSAPHSLLPLIGLLKSHAKLILLGVPDKPLELPVFPLILGNQACEITDSYILGILLYLLNMCCKSQGGRQWQLAPLEGCRRLRR